MQQQSSAIGSLPDSLNFDHGSSSISVGIDQQLNCNNLWSPAASQLSNYNISASNSDTNINNVVSQEGQNLGRWSIGESSSGNRQKLVCDKQMTQSVWSSSMNSSAGAGLRLGDRRYEPTNLVSQHGINLNSSSNQIANGSAFVRSSSSGSISQNHDLNEGYCHLVGNDIDIPNGSKSAAFENRFISSRISSSNLSASSSGSGGFLVDDERSGCTMDARRLCCKRKTLEGNGGQSSNSGTCFPREESSMLHAVPPPYDPGSHLNVPSQPEDYSSISPFEQFNPRLGLGMSSVSSADSPRLLNVRGGMGNSHRNYRLRINPIVQQDMQNNSIFPAVISNAGHTDTPMVHQPLRFAHPPIDSVSPITSWENLIPQSRSSILRVPTSRRNVQAPQWTRAPNLSPGSSSSYAAPGERDAALLEQLNPRSISSNIAEHPVFIPPVNARSSAQNPTNWSIGSGNGRLPRNIGSSSGTGSGSGSHSLPGPSWASHHQPPPVYSRRLSEYIRRSLLSGSEAAGQSLAFSQQGGVSTSNGNQGHAQSNSRSALYFDRQADGVVGAPPHSLRTLAAAAEGRSRLVSEIRKVLDIMRRGEALRFEDVMLLDPSIFFGMADIHDVHRDMRLDVDNMSYEELLALEERIGNVCTGLCEETISSRMKQRKYIHTMSSDQTDLEPCCICQEEYKEGEELGTLDCGHDFHCACIKQWLAQKNLCPICKTTALAT